MDNYTLNHNAYLVNWQLQDPPQPSVAAPIETSKVFLKVCDRFKLRPETFDVYTREEGKLAQKGKRGETGGLGEGPTTA
jgi:hypothetical protein